jgi:hypothetical protein
MMNVVITLKATSKCAYDRNRLLVFEHHLPFVTAVLASLHFFRNAKTRMLIMIVRESARRCGEHLSATNGLEDD